MNALPLVLTVFVACAVEAVEALTIVLAVGITREWKSTFQGMAAALVVLAVIARPATTRAATRQSSPMTKSYQNRPKFLSHFTIR